MKRLTTLVAAVMLALGMIAGPALGQGNGNGPDRDNSLRSEAEPVDLDPGDVEIHTSDPSQSNFEEEFTFYVVRHGVEFTESKYREPARTGPDNFPLGASSVGSFWFGVSAPDQDGIQHEIDHEGQVAFYMKEENTGQWKSLKAQFNGKGELLHVNGVEPQ